MDKVYEGLTPQQKELLDLLATGKSHGEIGTRFKLSGYGDFSKNQVQFQINELVALFGCSTTYYLAVIIERKKWLAQIETTSKLAQKESFNEGFANGFPRGIWRGVFYGILVAAAAFGAYIYFIN